MAAFVGQIPHMHQFIHTKEHILQLHSLPCIKLKKGSGSKDAIKEVKLSTIS